MIGIRGLAIIIADLSHEGEKDLIREGMSTVINQHGVQYPSLCRSSASELPP